MTADFSGGQLSCSHGKPLKFGRECPGDLQEADVVRMDPVHRALVGIVSLLLDCGILQLNSKWNFYRI